MLVQGAARVEGQIHCRRKNFVILAETSFVLATWYHPRQILDIKSAHVQSVTWKFSREGLDYYDEWSENQQRELGFETG